MPERADTLRTSDPAANTQPDPLTRHMPRLLLLGGLVAVAIYFGIALQRGTDGNPAPPQPDALGFLQYAQAFASGHPYVFAAGESPSTGSTSHLYPAVLAITCLLGARGSHLLLAAFLLNAACYLIWLQLFWQVARTLAPAQACLAASLALLNGLLVMTVMGLSDMGLFMVLSWGLWAALLRGRLVLAAPLIVLCVLARPEGMLLAFGLSVLGALQCGQRKPHARQMLAIAACGLLATASVFALNHALTGTCQFQSVAQKGYLKTYPLLAALGCGSRDFGLLVRELLFNLGGAARQAGFLPVAGGVLAIVGIGSMAWRTDKGLLTGWWLGCGLLALGLVAMSAWQGIASDRYLAWILPAWYLLAAMGVGEAAIAIGRRGVRLTLTVVLLGFELAAWPFFTGLYAAECVRTQANASFAQGVNATLPSSASIGGLSRPTMYFYLGARVARHLNGMTSPAFAGQREPACAIETLKHNPALRFTHWLIKPSEQAWCAQAGLLGDRILDDLDAPPDADVYAVYEACWDALPTVCLQPLDPTVIRAVAELRQVDQLDVGYVSDERRCRYRVGSRLPDEQFRPCVASGRIGGRRITEVGQPVIGWDEFRVQAPRPGQLMRVVLRTMLDATCTMARAGETFAGEELHLRSPLQIRPLVNGVALPTVYLPVAGEPGTFFECCFDIPASCVTTDPLEIVLAGDHLALAYWFYQ